MKTGVCLRATYFDAVVPVLEDMAIAYEIVCVNDGSRDATLDRLKAARGANQRIKIIDLSRNFGKELALTAGLEHAAIIFTQRLHQCLFL